MKRLILLMTMGAWAALACRGAVPEPGVWNDDFAGSLAYAESEGLPIVVVWGNTSCSYCNNLHEALDESDELEEWLSRHDVILVMKHEKYRSTDADYLAAKEWLKAINPSMSGFPFAGIHYRKSDGTVVVSSAFTARKGTMPATEPAGDLAGQFVGSLELLLGEVVGPMEIDTKALPLLSTVEPREVRLEAKRADGVCRWRHEAFGYDVNLEPSADTRLTDPDGFTLLTGDSEMDLPFDFPVNGKTVRRVFVGTNPLLFFSGADGTRVDMRPYADALEPTATFASPLSVKQGADFVAFRWLGQTTDGNEMTVGVLVSENGIVRYAYTGVTAQPAETAAKAVLSVLDGEEWTWSTPVSGESVRLCDCTFTPRVESTLPEGMVLSADGAMLGLPAKAGGGTFRVHAEDAAGAEDVASIAYEVSGSQLTPAAPGEAVASERTYVDRIVIEWTGDDVSKTYEIYRSETGSLEDAEYLDATADFSYADMECEAEVDYCYFIRGVNGEFAGEFTATWGRRAQRIAIATEILPAPEASVIYDERLEAEGGQGAIRWEVLPRGYDVTNAAPDAAWRSVAFFDADFEQELPFDFPINDSAARQVFVMPEGELFFNCADGVRASLRPLVAPVGEDVNWFGFGYRALGDRVMFRLQCNGTRFGNAVVLVELFPSGRIRYAYAGDLAEAGAAGYGQELSTLDGVEWKWRVDAADFGSDWLFVPQKGGPLPEGLMLGADGNLLGVPATNAVGATVRIVATDAIGELSERAYEIEVEGVLPSPEVAVGCGNLSFAFEETPWFVEEDEAFEGRFALQSGAVEKGKKSIAKALAYGSGTLTFAWKTASLDTDKTSFLLDGETVTNVTGNSEWTMVEIDVRGKCDHAFSWQFLCGKKSETTDGRTWLDMVRWEPRTLTLESALGQTGLVWTTTGDASWLPEEDENGIAFGMSGEIGDDESSGVRTTFTGAGTLAFEWKVSSEDDFDIITCYTNGVPVIGMEISGATGWSKRSISFGEGTHEVEWRYEKDDEDFDGNDCGYLRGVTWTPAATDPTIQVNGHRLTVPAEWVKANYPELASSVGPAAETKLLSTAANGKNSVWECYVAGLDPNDESAEFTATVEMVNGVPVITWNPDLNDGAREGVRRYIVKGANSVTGPWVEVSEGQEADYQFFTVTVDMP